MTTDDGLLLQACSPAIDAGDNTWIISSGDFRYASRTFNTTTDIGAYEFQGVLDRIDISIITASDSLFQATDTIQTLGMVDIIMDDTITFEAQEIVILKAGFHAQVGSNFTARINDCSASSSFLASEPETSLIEEIIEEQTLISRSISEVLSANLQVQVYPNPFREATMIEYYLPEAGSVELTITNLQGKRIHQQQFLQQQAGWQQIQLTITNLQAGMYFLSIRTNEMQEVKQLVVQKEQE